MTEPRPQMQNQLPIVRCLAGCNMGRYVLCAGILAVFAISSGCKKNQDDPPQTSELSSQDEAEGAAQEPADDSEAAETDQTEGADNQTEEDPASGQQQVRQEVRSPSPDERAYNTAEVHLIRERLGLIPPRPLDVENALRKTDIRRVTDFGGNLTKSPMMGTLPSHRHNGYRFATDEGFGFSLEVWTYPSESSTNSGYEEFRTTLIAGTPLERSSSPTTLSVFAGVRQLIVKDAPRNAVVSVSCSENLCTTQHLEALALLARQRL